MSNAEFFPLHASIVNILPTAARTTTANGTGVDMSLFTGSGVAFVLDAAAGTGTTPTNAIKLQSSPDNSTWTDVPGGAFAGLTTLASQQVLAFAASKVQKWVRAVSTIGGTTPSYTYSVNALAVNLEP